MHSLAIGFSPAYLSENADGIRRDWPRIPLPKDRKVLETSAALGEQVAALLNTESEVPAVTSGKVTAIFKTIGVITKEGGGQMDVAGGDLAVAAGWGHKGKEGVTMPARGKLAERGYDEVELRAIDMGATALGLPADAVRRLLGEKTFDVYLNGMAYSRNIPLNVWEYYIGGYQVIKKWLSYREDEILGRALKPDEAREVTSMARPAGRTHSGAASARRELQVGEGFGLRMAETGITGQTAHLNGNFLVTLGSEAHHLPRRLPAGRPE